jgi:predicted transcriptional regulator YdeE
MEEAVDWLKRCPNPHDEPGEVEIRQVFSADDFASEMTPEMREHEASIRAQTLGLGAVRFEAGRERLVAGFNNSYDMNTGSNIPALWARFAPHIGKVPGQIGAATYGVSWNMQPGGKFDYLAGTEVSADTKLPADFTRVTLPAGRYAVLTHEGHVSLLPQTFDKIFSQWLPDAGLKTVKAPCFERYTEKFNPKTVTGPVEIWVALEG